jgi:hypothetical protein
MAVPHGRSTWSLERMSRSVLAAIALTTLTLASPAANADVGLPLVAAFLPPMWIAFVPIVIVEAVAVSRLLAVPFGLSVLSTFLGNLASTLIGIPVTWLVLAVLELLCCGSANGLSTFASKLYAVTVQAPWLIPYEQDFWWMIPCALAVMAVPFFIASVLIEAPINRLLLKDAPTRTLWRATALANLASYAVLGLLLWPAWKVADHFQGFFGPITEWFAELTFKVAGALSGHHQ